MFSTTKRNLPSCHAYLKVGHSQNYLFKICRTLLTLRGLLEAFIFCQHDYCKLFRIFSFFPPRCKCMTVKVPPSVCSLESKRTNTSNLYFVTVLAVDTIAVDFGKRKEEKNKQHSKKRQTAASLIPPRQRKAPITLRWCSASKADPTLVLLYVFFWLLRLAYLQEQSTALIPNDERCGR